MKLDKLIKDVKKKFKADIRVNLTEQSIILSGEMDNWEDIVNVGYLFVDPKSRVHVVNNIKLRGMKKKKTPLLIDNSLQDQEYDVIIVGGGIIGTTILRELSRYSLKLLLIEKEADLACGASGANDGMIHPGIDLSKDSKKAKYCLAGNLMYEKLSKELDFPFKRIGQYIVFGSQKERILSSYLLYKAKQWEFPESVNYRGQKSSKKNRKLNLGPKERLKSNVRGSSPLIRLFMLLGKTPSKTALRSVWKPLAWDSP
jgi:glycerol-3-phosphate dehydrogenase